MSGELFPVETVAVKSPRLLWCERHGIVVSERPRRPADERFMARGQRLAFDGEGSSAEEACRDLGVKNSIALWNEECGA